jgi:hypothetical protein
MVTASALFGLAAPVIVHLTANCAGPLASAVNSRMELNRGNPVPPTGFEPVPPP